MNAGIMSWIFFWKIKREPSYAKKTLPIFIHKNTWLTNALFNELYHAHPETWTWIKTKMEEYKTL